MDSSLRDPNPPRPPPFPAFHTLPRLFPLPGMSFTVTKVTGQMCPSLKPSLTTLGPHPSLSSTKRPFHSHQPGNSPRSPFSGSDIGIIINENKTSLCVSPCHLKTPQERVPKAGGCIGSGCLEVPQGAWSCPSEKRTPMGSLSCGHVYVWAGD